MSADLRVSKDRAGHYGETGILVRAKMPDERWGNADIADLDAESLLRWLRSRGGENGWAEAVVYMLLGHGQEDFQRAIDEVKARG